jgi:raffinose/stachyose/melibiose transport system substrate-binding protein
MYINPKNIAEEDVIMNNRLKKIMSVLLCAAMVMVLFIGCSGDQSASDESNNAGSSNSSGQSSSDIDDSQTSSEKVTLTLLTDNQSPKDGLNAVIEAIEEKYNIATEIELRPGGDEGENIVRTRLASGEMTDLNLFNSGALFFTLNPESNFVDLTNEPYMESLDDQFKKVVSVNGKVYAAPANPNMATGNWLYNKKIYADLGLLVPKTWEELMNNCEKIKAAGKTAVIGSYKDSWTAQLILLGDYYNVQAQVPDFAEQLTAGKAKFATTPAALRSFEKIAEPYKRGFMNKDFLSTTYDQALKMLADGEGAHYPMLSQGITAIAINYPDKINDIGFFAQPGDSPDINGATVWMPGAASIYNKSKNIDAAKKWLEYFVSQEGVNTYMAKQKPDGPLVIKGAVLPDDIYPAVKDEQAYVDTGKIAPALEFLTPVKGPNSPQICVEVGAGFKTPLEGAQEYDKDLEKQAKQLNLPGW